MPRRRVGLAILLATCLGAIALGTSFADRADGGASRVDTPTRAADVAPPDTSSALVATTTPTDTNSVPAATTAPAPQPAELGRAAFEAVGAVVEGTTIGLAVYDRRAGTFLATRNAEQQFYAASVVKLLIAVDVLQQAGPELPPERIREQLAAMLSLSNDGVATALWHANGGPEIDRRMIELIGLSHTAPPRQPEEWELTRMSALDVVTTYEFIENDLPGSGGGLVEAALMAATNQAADGFDQFFGIPRALPGAESAIKQGWMRVRRGVVLHTTGVVGPDARYVVALLTELPVGTDFETGRDAVTTGVSAIAPYLGTGRTDGG